MEKDSEKMIRDVDYRATRTQKKPSLPVVGVCKFCGRKFSVSEFKDRFALTEFIISGLCQVCQDETAEDGK